jgi:3-hydroxybutyryl-CoA dehydrogenase
MKNIFRDVKTVGVVGAGGMGEGIALNFAQAGLSVHVITRSESTMNKCLAQIEDSLQLFEEMELLKEKSSAIRSRIHSFFMSDLKNAVKDCDFIVESIPEVLDTKRELLAQLDSCKSDVIISSNTSTFPVSVLAEKMRTPERVVGTHYFMPAHIIPLVEVHWGEKTDMGAVEATKKLMEKVGKKPILVRKAMVGFIVNRIQGAIVREAQYLIDQGAVSIEDFDSAARASYGFRLANLGPMAQMDVNGLDVAFRGHSRVYKDLCNVTEPAPSFKEKIEKGELGIKTGKGFYDYSGKTAPQVMKEVETNLLKQLALFKQREGIQ